MTRLDTRSRSVFRRVLLAGACACLALACSGPDDGNKTDAGTTDTGKPAPGGANQCGHTLAKGVDYIASPQVSTADGAIKDKQLLKIASGGISAGATVDTTLKVANTANANLAAELRVAGVTLSYTAPKDVTDSGPVFECFAPDGKGGQTACDKADFGVVVPAGYDCAKLGANARTELPIAIRFTKPKDDKVRIATVKFDFLIDNLGSHAGLTVILTSVAGAAHIVVVPDKAQFETVGLGLTKEVTVSVNNAGDTDLVIDHIEVAVDDIKPFQMIVDGATYKGGSTAGPTFTLKKGETKDLRVLFTAINSGPHQSKLRIFSNDVQSPTLVPLLANNNVPCLTITPSPTLNFGFVVVGGKTCKKVTLTSCGNDPVNVTSLQLTDNAEGIFQLDTSGVTQLGGKPLSADNPITLKTNQSEAFFVCGQPTSENGGKPFTAKLAVKDNTIQPDKGLNLLATGTATACPTAIIESVNGEQVLPQQEAPLKGSGSVASGKATIQEWKWTVLKQPAGVAGYSWLPNDKTPDAKYGVDTKGQDGKVLHSLNVAGEYVFQLEVTDSEGLKSCTPASFVLGVIPDTGIHVELTWDTPEDKDKTDTGPEDGSDLDLHFAHPYALKSTKCANPPSGVCQPDEDGDGNADPWFQSTFDCMWNNTAPSWGSLSLNDDDAGLDLDDTSGWGPENLNLKSPQNDTQYWVGVHYWDAHGFGDSTATVNIFILGTLKGTYTQLLKECDLWWVKNIDWPSGSLLDVPGAVLQAPSAGKITPKYWSALAKSLKGKCK